MWCLPLGSWPGLERRMYSKDSMCLLESEGRSTSDGAWDIKMVSNQEPRKCLLISCLGFSVELSFLAWQPSLLLNSPISFQLYSCFEVLNFPSLKTVDQSEKEYYGPNFKFLVENIRWSRVGFLPMM